MAIQAETTIEGAPFAKFKNLGDVLVAAFGGGKQRQQQKFDTREPVVKADGKPAKEEILYLIAMPGTTAGTGDREAAVLEPINPGDQVRFAISGYRWKLVIDQRKALPPYAGFAAGKACSGDVYTIRLAGWSAAIGVNGPATQAQIQAAVNAGFVVVEGRIILRTQEDKDKFVLARSRSGGNTNSASDFDITIRRPNADEKAFEQQADALFLSRPWENQAALATTAGGDSSYEEPF